MPRLLPRGMGSLVQLIAADLIAVGADIVIWMGVGGRG